MPTRDPILAQAEALGIILPGVHSFLPVRIAQDAVPALVTTSNAGIPAYLTNYIDPRLIEVLTAPNEAANILGGEQKKGAWKDETSTFPVIEHTGESTVYGDWNENGSVGANPTFPQRQHYRGQTITRWGELQLEKAEAARIDWAARLNVASAIILDKAMNSLYFYGIAGLQNYGLLNDPNLFAPITPGPKAWSSNNPGGWTSGAIPRATPTEVFSDIQALAIQLFTQSNGLINAKSRMTLAMSPQSSGALVSSTQFNVSVEDLLKKNFPNLEVKVAPQYYNTSAGNLVQLIANEVNGQETAIAAYSEKLRAHPIIVAKSSWEQKKSFGGWGAIIFQPFAIAQMVGV